MQKQILVDLTKVRSKLKELVEILAKDQRLLEDEEVKEWLRILYPIALEHGDREVKMFFHMIRSKI